MKLPLGTDVIITLTATRTREKYIEIGRIVGVNDYTYRVNVYGLPLALNEGPWDVNEHEVARAVFSFVGPVPV